MLLQTTVTDNAAGCQQKLHIIGRPEGFCFRFRPTFTLYKYYNQQTGTSADKCRNNGEWFKCRKNELP